MSALARALARWQHAAGVYWPYVCAAPFVVDAEGAVELSGSAGDLPHPRGSAGGRARTPALPEGDAAACKDLIPPGRRAAIFVDLPPAETLPAAPALAENGLLVVPVIQRWVATGAVLPCERLLAQLIACAPRARPRDPSGAVFLLDGDRAGPAHGRAPAPRQFDNRYSYPACRFPPIRFLQADGVETVRWIARGGIAADLQEYAQDLAAAGLELEIVAAPRC